MKALYHQTYSKPTPHLLQTNELLQRYIESLTGINVNFESGRKRSNISDTTRQCQLRKLNEIKSIAQCAMWFIDNFGLKLDSLVVSDTNGRATRKRLKISSNIFDDLHQLHGPGCFSRIDRINRIKNSLYRYIKASGDYKFLSLLLNSL